MKQLRYGSFRPGSRRSRAAREESALIHASPGLFQGSQGGSYTVSKSMGQGRYGHEGWDRSLEDFLSVRVKRVAGEILSWIGA